MTMTFTTPPFATALRATAAIAALIGALCLAGEAPAATKECRQLQSRKERNLCYEEQAKAKAAAPARTPRSRMESQLDQMQIENERVQKRLKGICRGC